MTLHVYSARISYRGPDRFDVTRKSGGEAGAPFAPSWSILKPALEARRKAEAILAERPGWSAEDLYRDKGRDVCAVLERRAAEIERRAWEEYVPKFLAEMARSFDHNFGAWHDLLARERVVLVCYCIDAERCHRALLRRDILPSKGAIDCGEIVARVAA